MLPFDVSYSVGDIELQLPGLKFDENVKTTLDLADDMPQHQRRLVETVITTTRQPSVSRLFIL